MKNILKYFSFFIILNFISCDDGYNNTQVNVIGSGIPLSSFKAVLGAPENNRTCFTGKSISETKSEVTFKWSDQIKTDFSDCSRISELKKAPRKKKRPLWGLRKQH